MLNPHALIMSKPPGPHAVHIRIPFRDSIETGVGLDSWTVGGSKLGNLLVLVGNMKTPLQVIHASGTR